MQKPKILCVVGSAILSPLLLLAGAFVAGVIMNLVWVLRFPEWVYWTALILGALSFPWPARDLYRWLFGRCYDAKQT